MKKNKFRLIIFLPVILGFISFTLSRLNVLKGTEFITYDWRMKFNSREKPSDKTVFVFIGEETLKPLGGWPISRQWYAEFTKIMKEFGAKVVVFDILFLDPKDNEDIYFAENIKNSKNVILPYFFNNLKVKKDIFEADGVSFPVNILKENAGGLGFVNYIPDADGVVRKYPLFAKYKGVLYDSLGMAVLKKYYNVSKIEITDRYVLINIDKNVRKIPVEENCSAYLNFYPDISRFRNFSFIQVFKSYLQFKKGKVPVIPPEEFFDKIVIVGLTAVGVSDSGPVSGISNYPLAGVHINFLENFLNNEFIKKADKKFEFLIPLFLSFITVSTTSALSPLIGLSIILVLSYIFVYFSFWIFRVHFIYLNISSGIIAIFLSYLSVVIIQFIYEVRSKYKMKSIFGKYVPASTVDKLIEYEKDLSLSGEGKYLTVLFADIRGFTTIAERLSPEETFEFLNEVLGVMTGAIFDFGGMLDKFIGDEIMAIFGTPVEDEKHPLKAVLSAIEIMRRIKKRFEFVKVGIGINTGEMMIGNIGTERRMEYTAIGDEVNLASRIQKIAGPGEILITENTFKEVENKVKVEFIGEIEIKGKEEKVRVYRVLWNEEERREK